MKIRFITTLLTALLTLSVAQAQEFEFTYEGQTLKYKVTAENEVRVEKLDDNLSGDVIIPSKVTLGKKKYKVTRIRDEAFPGCKNLQSVVIPNSVTSIGVRAFYSCLRLSKIKVSSDNKHYSSKDGVLFNKAGDTLLAVPITLTSYTIPNTVKHIGDGAFWNCANLQSIVIPNSVTSIGNEAFFGCSPQNFVIPSSVMSIGSGAFEKSSSQRRSIFQDFFFTYEGIALRYEIIAENEVWVTRKCDWEGYNLSGELKIPSEVEFESKKYKVTRIGEGAFGNCGNLQSVVIPNSVKAIGVAAFSTCCNLQSVVIPNSVTSIKWGTFSSCTNLQSVVIPNSVTSIGTFAFNGCANLQNVVIPNSVTSIGAFAFEYCRRLQSIVIPNSVTNIGRSAFGDAVLQTFTIEAQTPPIIRDCIFLELENILPTIYVPAASVEKYKAAEGWKNYADKIKPFK